MSGLDQARFREVLGHFATGVTIVTALEKLELKFPQVDSTERSEFKQIRKALEDEGKASAVTSAVTKAVVAKAAAK